MSKQAYNPYLPQGEYIPDGEPHVFGNRVYIYGSHDKVNSIRYCPGDYVVWSASVDDLSTWSNPGVAYARRGVRNPLGLRCLWAPDCARGSDGRYYLYYCFDFDNRIMVAVSKHPDKGFVFYGYVHHPNGVLYGSGSKDIMCFDPGILVDDDGEVYLYSGYSANEDLRKMLNRRGIKNVDGTGGQVIHLEKDMLTVKEDPKMVIPGYKNSSGTGFEGHEMYEASSIRKFNGKYYFIYSSRLSHELCYAISDYPDRGFRYGGALISNGDIGYGGRKTKDALNYWGNIHGSIECINGRYCVFYHRQTSKTEQSRQGCAEMITMEKDGSFKQVEMTSQGLNGKPLKGEGTYPSYIACNLVSKEGALKCAYGVFSKHKYKLHPYIGEYEKGKQAILGMRNGSIAGFKYFDLQGKTRVGVRVRGTRGRLLVKCQIDGETIGSIPIDASKTWKEFFVELALPKGVSGLFFLCEGDGKIDFLNFSLTKIS